MSSTSRKSEFLGMPFGTAHNRLRKKILFSLVQRLEEDTCYRCNKTIESVDDLSIEHKQAWEGKSIELYWDLSNIAFSHLRCNSGSTNREKTHCIHGHDLNENNIRMRKNHYERECLPCKRDRDNKFYKTDYFKNKRKLYPSRRSSKES